MSLRDFFFEGEAADEVVDALVDGERGIAERHRCCGFDLLFGGWRRRQCLRGSLSGCGKRQKESNSENGWMAAHGIILRKAIVRREGDGHKEVREC